MKSVWGWAALVVLLVGLPTVSTTFVGCGPSYTSEETERQLIEREDAEDPEADEVEKE